MSRPAYHRGRKGGRPGQWVAVADLGWRLMNPEGEEGSRYRRDRREFTAPTKREAEEKRDAFLHRRREGFTPPKGRPMYVSEWLGHWLHQVIKGHVEETTWHKSYRPAIEDYAVPFFSRTPLPEVTREDVEAWHAWLARRPGRKAAHLSAVTRRNAHRVLSTALKEAEARDLLLRNPCPGVRLPLTRQAEVSPPTLEQARVILDACRTWPNGARWVLAIATGVRQGEALALQWRDVRLDGPSPSITVRRSRARVNGEWVVKTPKSAKSRRVVPLLPVAVTALRAHRAAQTVTSLEGLVFTSRRGEPVHAPADHRDWRRLLASLGLPEWRVHDARHATATLLLKAGVPVRVVQEILGHSSAAITQNVYQHVAGELTADAMAALGEALGDG